MTSISQREKLQATIWSIADEVRGAIDGWDFKQFVLGTLFYRYISEDFINTHDLDAYKDKSEIIEGFFTYAQEKQREESALIIKEEKLEEEPAKRYIQHSLNREYASENGMELPDALPKGKSKLSPDYLSMKKRVFLRISSFVEKFKGIGGRI